METVSNVRAARDKTAQLPVVPAIPLELLPFPAVLIDHDGIIMAANPEWLKAHPDAGPGDRYQKWCDRFQEFAPEFCNALKLGVEGTLRGGRGFSQAYGGDQHYSVTVAPAAGGVLVFYQNLNGGAAQFPPSHDQKMATVGRLVGGVAHDFANLLTLIAGYSDILLNRVGEKDPLRPELDEIRKAAHRGSQLTSQLLGYARGQDRQPKLVDLNALIGDTARMLQPIIGEDIDLRASLATNLAAVTADPGQMEQVIMNLILNARDAMPGGGRIRIETSNRYLQSAVAWEHGLEAGPYVVFTVTDTGHGIDPAVAEHLFEPFFSTKQRGKGTGLGLSTVRDVVKQYGDAVWASGGPGEGAVFTVCLPRSQHLAGTGEAPALSNRSDAGDETVLLVEDEDGVRRLLTHVLNKRGYQVLEASNAEEALRIFDTRAADIDLVITDIVMPKMNGCELGERLRAARPETKIIYMSGYTDDVLVRTGALGPGIAILQKPLRPEVLTARVREALDSPSRPFNPS